MTHSLAALGWSAQFLSQLSIDEIGVLTPARVTAVHRDRLDALTETGPARLIPPAHESTGQFATGDWVLADAEGRVARLLDRKSVLHRRAAGTDARDQLIAANLDTLFVVSSANADFNLARIERFLAVAHAGGVSPVVVLTKADLADPAPYLDALREALPATPALALDARAPGAALADWLGKGQTVGLIGSSGVGKSTLATALSGEEIVTQGIREDDAKGRHTTTAREMHGLPGGGWLIDTPGMRALRLAGAEAGVDAVFDDIAALAETCRFSDCQHQTEPGCAVQAAIEDGSLDPARLLRWQKLKREDAHNSETIAEAHARSRAFGKMVRHVMTEKKRQRGD